MRFLALSLFASLVFHSKTAPTENSQAPRNRRNVKWAAFTGHRVLCWTTLQTFTTSEPADFNAWVFLMTPVPLFWKIHTFFTFHNRSQISCYCTIFMQHDATANEVICLLQLQWCSSRTNFTVLVECSTFHFRNLSGITVIMLSLQLKLCWVDVKSYAKLKIVTICCHNFAVSRRLKMQYTFVTLNIPLPIVESSKLLQNTARRKQNGNEEEIQRKTQTTQRRMNWTLYNVALYV